MLDKTILIVDDDDAIRALLITILRRRGFTLDAARNGVEALEKLESSRYALVILDLMMPRMSGYEVLDALCSVPETHRPFVLVLTAGTIPRPFDSRCVIGAIQKPFDIDLIVDTVVGCLAAVDAVPAADRPSPTLTAAVSGLGKAN